MRSPSSPEAIASAERRARIFELRKSGKSYEEIGRIEGISKQAAHKHVRRTLVKLNGSIAETAEEVRRIDLETLNDLQAAIYGRATDPGCESVDVPADNETGVRGYDGQDKAIDRVLRIMDRRAKLLGLDIQAAQKHEVTGADGAPLGLPAHLVPLWPKAESGDADALAAIEQWIHGRHPRKGEGEGGAGE